MLAHMEAILLSKFYHPRTLYLSTKTYKRQNHGN
jgi:hypothetical protein